MNAYQARAFFQILKYLAEKTQDFEVKHDSENQTILIRISKSENLEYDRYLTLDPNGIILGQNNGFRVSYEDMEINQLWR